MVEFFIHADVALSLSTLSLLKWQDERGHDHTFRLVDHVSYKWMEFGLAVGLLLAQLKALERQYRDNANRCWLEVMEQWLSGGGTGAYPATWEGLCSLLRDCGYAEVAASLCKALSQCHTS